MLLPEKQIKTTQISYWRFFRLVFVISSLYLLGDAFYRWDGFTKYASFSEFLPGVALAYILWTALAIIATILIWPLFRVSVRLSNKIGLQMKMEHLLLFMILFILAGVLVRKIKLLQWIVVQSVLDSNYFAFVFLTSATLFSVWLFRNKAEKWIGIIQESITPVVWLFCSFLVISPPLVAYHTWIKQTDKVVINEFSQAAATDKERPNIILITFDTLRAQNMSVYGHNKPTTPFIKKWSEDATLFSKAEAGSNYTSPTTACLMTGKRVWTHRLFQPHGYKPFKSNTENLPLLLKESGYKTIAFVIRRFASPKTLGVYKDFDIAPSPIAFSEPNSVLGIIDSSLYRIFGEKIRLYNWLIKEDFVLYNLLWQISMDFSSTEFPPEKAFRKFFKLLDNTSPQPFFAWIHVDPPHRPYLPPEPYMGMFNSSPELRSFKSQLELLLRSKKQKIQRESLNILRDRYNEFIRYCDEQFENFIEDFQKRSTFKNTVIILSSDHGESFEHDFLEHGGPLLYEQLTNIPLIIKEPDQSEGRTVSEILGQVDIPATILDFANIKVPSWMEGRSLKPLMRNRERSPEPVFSMALHANRNNYPITKGTIAIWKDGYKLIHSLTEKKSLLFNLKQDPGELNDLFVKEPEVVQHLLNIILENLKAANEKIISEE